MENDKFEQLVNARFQCAQMLNECLNKLEFVQSLAFCHNREDEISEMCKAVKFIEKEIADDARELLDGMNRTNRERLRRYLDGICAELEHRLHALCFDDLCTVSNDTSGNDCTQSRSLVIDSGNLDEARTVYQVFIPNSFVCDHDEEQFDTFSVCVITWEGELENTDAIYENIDECVDFIYADMESKGLNP